jgi:valyl-tRNA synthetase
MLAIAPVHSTRSVRSCSNSGTVDVAAEKIRLAKELTKLEQAVAAGEAKLTNDAFVSKAPPKILEGARKQLDDAKAKRDEIARMLATLG